MQDLKSYQIPTCAENVVWCVCTVDSFIYPPSSLSPHLQTHSLSLISGNCNGDDGVGEVDDELQVQTQKVHQTQEALRQD